MDYKYWIDKALEYAKVHPSIIDVSELYKDDIHICFNATFRINLPSKYDLLGETSNGVRKVEIVRFYFNELFPLKSPEITLRDDFPRCFPHINPSLSKVKPCIFDGSLDELLQQPKWFDHLLDQMVEWLEKAASNSLMDKSQGWEPIRLDTINGFIIYEKEIIEKILQNIKDVQSSYVSFKRYGNSLISSLLSTRKELIERDDVTRILFFTSEPNKNNNKYLSNPIQTFSQLNKFAVDSHIKDLSKSVNVEITNSTKPFLFITLNIRRPYNLTNSNSNYELFNCAIEIRRNRKNGKVHQKSKVYILQNITTTNEELLKRFSGISDNKKQILQIGCGSLGSKLSLHLARNGIYDFTLADNDYFSPHNNARHALVSDQLLENKAKLLSDTMKKLNVSSRIVSSDIRQELSNITDIDYIIDSSANLSVRQFLFAENKSSIIINTSLYSDGTLPILLIEGKNKNPNLLDIFSYLFTESLTNCILRKGIFTNKSVYTSIGQGCGSYTTVCQDSLISLSASSMALIIQKYISEEDKEKGLLCIGDITDDSISWKKINIPPVYVPKNLNSKINVRILEKAYIKMAEISSNYSPNEYGGVLIGHISNFTNTIIVTDLVTAPEDSKYSRTYFELGTKGLKNKIKGIERKSNELITYVGTWHSHPLGGNASNIDRTTKTKLIILRNYEPTICLIWTPDGILNI